MKIAKQKQAVLKPEGWIAGHIFSRLEDSVCPLHSNTLEMHDEGLWKRADRWEGQDGRIFSAYYSVCSSNLIDTTRRFQQVVVSINVIYARASSIESSEAFEALPQKKFSHFKDNPIRNFLLPHFQSTTTFSTH